MTSGNTYVWRATVKAPSSAGNHTARSEAYINGSWKSGKEFSVFVSNSQSMSQTSSGERRVSDAGINFIAQSEGLVSSGTPYEDSLAGYIPTIGYGLVLYKGDTFYNNLTKEMAYALLLDKVNNGVYSSSVNNFLMGNGIKFSQQQFDALVSFTYNLGSGWMSKDLGNMIKNIGGSGGTATSATVVATSLNIRKGPGTSYDRVGSVSKGQTVTIVSGPTNGDWYQIRTSSGMTGYGKASGSDGTYLSLNYTGGNKDLNNINQSAFKSEVSAYHHSGGKCYRGLLYRRWNELAIFFYGDYTRRTNGSNPYGFPNEHNLK